jgi:dTDP-4-amino-4,6-dideoxygalactose transaminase
VGSLGHAAIFSFYSTKLLAAGEGGVVVSKDARVIQQIHDLRECDHKPADKPRQNIKWTDLQAALFLSQLRRLKAFNRRREEIAHRYDKALEHLPIHLPVRMAGRVYWRYVVRCRGNVTSLIRAFERKGVAARRPVERPIHWDLGGRRQNFPGTEQAWSQCLSLPLYPAMQESEIRKVTFAAQELLG